MLNIEVPKYDAQIEEDSKHFGFKAANLIYLQNQMKAIEFQLEAAKLNIKVAIPNFVPTAHELIESHLDKYANKINGWRELFNKFENAYERQVDKKTLEPTTVDILQKLQEHIIQCFIDNDFSSEELNEFLKKVPSDKIDSTLLMVRSTGVNEDKVDMANPGGNLSMPAKTNNFSKAIGMVAASVVSEKSLLQRLKAGDQNITEKPVMPILIQKLIGGQNIVSGVIYTNSGAMRIQAAPGHGEYVVNSKGPTDNYYISNEGIIYSEIRPKSYKLAPKINTQDNSITLSWESNSTNNEYSQSLTTQVLQALQIVANQIEDAYKMRMDIEFVYDVEAETINIVQARPIPHGNRKNLVPSALSPHYLAKPTQTLQTIEGLHIITPEVNTAAVISDPSQVIICKDIKDALEEFLNPKNVDRDFRAVIVENYAPDTSHEAGQFNLNALPVIQVADITTISKIMEEIDPLIIIDPQHRKIYQMDPSLRNSQNDIHRIEAGLYNINVLEEGIFSSSLSAYVSPRDYDFSQDFPGPEKLIENAINHFKGKDPKLGQLVNMAEMGDVTAMPILFSVAFEAMKYHRKAEGNTFKSKTAASTPTQMLTDSFKILETPKIGEDNEICKSALAQILKTVAQLRRSGLISNTVFKQSMISGSEVAILLYRMEDEVFRQQDKNTQDAAFLEYFNVKRKFEGVILGKSNRSVLVQSVMTDLFNKKQKMIVNNIAMNVGIDLTVFNEDQKTILYEISKLSAAKNDLEFNEDWIQFCLEVCQSKEGANQLSAIVSNLVKLDIHENWLNLFFAKALKVHQGNVSKVLSAINNDFNGFDLQSIKESQRMISEIDAQIPNFADKLKFDAAFKDLQNNLGTLNHLLTYRDNLSDLQKFILIQNVKKFIDVMDRTIKSLDYSRDYQDSESDNVLRAQRLRQLIASFRDCMAPWLSVGYPLEGAQIRLFLEALDKAIENSTANDTKKIIKTLKFDASRAIIEDTKGKGKYSGWMSGSYHMLDECKNLEDCFSCIHQNFMSAVDQVERQQDLIMGREFYPPIIAQFEEALMENLKGKVIDGHGTPVSNPENHLNESNPHVIYRIPLSIHNALVTVFKTGDDQYMLQFATGSPFAEESHRWRIISAKSNFDLVASDIHSKSMYRFKHESNFMYSAKFCATLSADKIPLILKTIEQSIANTYQSSYANHTSADEERFILLEKMDTDTLIRHHDTALSLIKDGYFMRTQFFNTNTAKRLEILHKLVNQIDPRNLFSFDNDLTKEELIQKEKFSIVRNLINNSEENGISLFFSHLYNSGTDDTFCIEMTGYSKTEFIQQYLSQAEDYKRIAVFNGILNNPEIINLLKEKYKPIVDTILKKNMQSGDLKEEYKSITFNEKKEKTKASKKRATLKVESIQNDSISNQSKKPR